MRDQMETPRLRASVAVSFRSYSRAPGGTSRAAMTFHRLAT
jgi:hypothetical protein